MPNCKSIDNMDIDEFFDAVAQARVVHEILVNLIACGVSKGINGNKE